MRSHTVPSNNRATIKASRNAPIFFRHERDARLLCLLRTVRKPFRVILCTPCVDTFRVPKRLAFKARVLLTFRTPLASNRLRHFFNAQATNNNNNNKSRSARSFETEVTEENLASRASKSRESSRPKNEDDVKKEKDERQQANEDRRHAEVHSPPRAREITTTHGAGWSSRGSLDLDFRDVRVRVPSRRVYFSREEWYKRKRL